MPTQTDSWKKAVEARLVNVETRCNLLKDEVGGLASSIKGLLAADREKTNALDGHHQAYAAASLRAEYAEDRASRAEKRIEALETELAGHRAKHAGGA